MINCFGSIAKYLVFLTNLIVFLASCVSTGFGIYYLVENNAVEGSEEYDQLIAATICSGLALLLALFGTLGAWKENRTLISIHFIVMFLLSYVTTIWSTMLRTHTPYSRNGLPDEWDSEKVGIVATAVTAAMILNLLVVYLFSVCIGEKKVEYVSI